MSVWKSESGMTLMELLVSILILSLLVVAMGTGMDAAMRIYTDARFETDSAALAGILNAALSDVLSHARDIRQDGETTFTNPEYGIQAGTLGISEGLLCLRRGSEWEPVVNSGAYPGLAVEELQIIYAPPGEETVITLLDGTVSTVNRGGVFYVSYRIVSTDGTEKTRDAETLVRVLNPE